MRFEDLTQLSNFLEVLNRIITSAMIYGGAANRDSHMTSDKFLLINLKCLCNSLNYNNEKLLNNNNMKVIILVDDGYYQLGIEKSI